MKKDTMRNNHPDQ